MITEQELARARKVVDEVVISVNHDRDKALTVIIDMCSNNPELHELFAKVGMELFDASSSVKH